jgi:hypothetical protein
VRILFNAIENEKYNRNGNLFNLPFIRVMMISEIDDETNWSEKFIFKSKTGYDELIKLSE